MVGKLTIGIVLAVAIWHIATHPETRVFAKADTQTATLHDKSGVNPSFEQKPRIEPLSASLKEATEVTNHSDISNSSTEQAKNISLDAPGVVWQRLISHGLSREQTATGS